MDDLTRIPPHHVEAEQSVLGSLLIDRNALSEVSGRLKAEAFYLEKHKEIYEAIMTLYEESLQDAVPLKRSGMWTILPIWPTPFPPPPMYPITYRLFRIRPY